MRPYSLSLAAKPVSVQEHSPKHYCSQAANNTYFSAPVNPILSSPSPRPLSLLSTRPFRTSSPSPPPSSSSPTASPSSVTGRAATTATQGSVAAGGRDVFRPCVFRNAPGHWRRRRWLLLVVHPRRCLCRLDHLHGDGFCHLEGPVRLERFGQRPDLSLGKQQSPYAPNGEKKSVRVRV